MVFEVAFLNLDRTNPFPASLTEPAFARDSAPEIRQA